MSLLTYILIGLVTVEIDAVLCKITDTKCRPISSIVWAMVWPIMCLFVVVAVYRIQNAERKK